MSACVSHLAILISLKQKLTEISLSIIAVHGLASNPKTTWLARAPTESHTEHNQESAATQVHESAAVPTTPPGKTKGWTEWCIDLKTRAFRWLLRRGLPNEERIENRPNWLSDFLPRELPVRVMAYHHESRWLSNALAMSLHDHAMDLLYTARRVREKTGGVRSWSGSKRLTRQRLFILTKDRRANGPSSLLATVSGVSLSKKRSSLPKTTRGTGLGRQYLTASLALSSLEHHTAVHSYHILPYC